MDMKLIQQEAFANWVMTQALKQYIYNPDFKDRIQNALKSHTSIKQGHYELSEIERADFVISMELARFSQILVEAYNQDLEVEE